VHSSSNIPIFHLHGSTPATKSVGTLTLFPWIPKCGPRSGPSGASIFESPPGACHESSSITMFGGVQRPCLARALARPGGHNKKSDFQKGTMSGLALSACRSMSGRCWEASGHIG